MLLRKWIHFNRLTLTLLFLAACSCAAAQDSETLFDERAKSIVAVEMFVQREIDRDPVAAAGIVFDDEGRIILLDSAVPSWLPPERFKDIRVRPLGKDIDGYKATYLGQDFLTGYHFLQLDEGLEHFTSITKWGKADLKRGQSLWGIGVMNKPWHFMPYYLNARLSAIELLPWELGFATSTVTSPGSALFDEAGKFAGWGGQPPTEEKLLIMSGGQQRPIGLQDMRDTSAFLPVERFYEFIQRIPSKPIGDDRPWLGITGMQALSREVAQFLGLENQGAVVISDVIEDSPSSKVGIQSKDIIVKLDGEPLPKLRPDVIIPRYLETEIMRHQIGDMITLTLIRGDEEIEVEIELDTQPKVLKEALRIYYPELGLGIREFLLMDGIVRRQLKVNAGGVVADFVKPNSKVSAAGLEPNDWIKEIDGTKINTFAQAEEILNTIEGDTGKAEVVILVERNNETKVLRVKLK